MGARGPVPERKDNLLGHRSKDELDGNTVTRVRIPTKVSIPQHEKDWHPIAIRIYRSVKQSGQSQYFEPSDWAMLYFACDELTHYMSPAGKRSAMKLAQILQLFSSLLMTEGDRRRVAMEIDRGPVDTSVEDQAADFYGGMGVI